MPEANWGYDFICYQTVEAMQAAFNAAGPWQWERRDSDIYGFYLKCRPMPQVEISVYQRSQFRNSARPDREFNAWLAIGAESAATQSEIEAVFRRLLQSVHAIDITET